MVNGFTDFTASEEEKKIKQKGALALIIYSKVL